MTLTSNTIVRNGMPFIGFVLRQVLPFVDKAFVTISTKCTDETPAVINELYEEYGDKIEVDWEEVKAPGDLTHVRQHQLDRSKTDWILFLDDDDYWPSKSLKEMLKHLNDDVDAFGISPYQVVDQTHYDDSWRNKYFTKFFRREGANYRHPWPRDLIYKGDELLYWRKNPRVPTLPIKFFHLSNIKNHSFRDERWASEFKSTIGRLKEYPKEAEEDVRRIFRAIK